MRSERPFRGLTCIGRVEISRDNEPVEDTFPTNKQNILSKHYNLAVIPSILDVFKLNFEMFMKNKLLP